MGIDSGKIFCVGAGKTGTTSLEALFRSLGFTVGDQERGELLVKDWAIRNFAPIVSLAETAQFFQDLPFSCPFTFQAMDMAFPGSKFILSVRSDAEQWYSSLVRFHTKVLGKGRMPTAEDLRSSPYRYAGWALVAQKLIYGVDDDDLYEMEKLTRVYNAHNESVIKYFEHRKDALLIIDVAQRDAVCKIFQFLDLEYNGEAMPHLNSSR